MSVNNLKLSMVEYIKFHMLINNLEQTELAEKAGTSQSMVSKVTKRKAGIGATIELYLYCGGKITGIEESKAELLKSYLGENNE